MAQSKNATLRRRLLFIVVAPFLLIYAGIRVVGEVIKVGMESGKAGE